MNVFLIGFLSKKWFWDLVLSRMLDMEGKDIKHIPWLISQKRQKSIQSGIHDENELNKQQWRTNYSQANPHLSAAFISH